MRSFLGKPLKAITLSLKSEGTTGPWTEALSDNYLKMKIAGRHPSNSWLTPRVEALDGDHLIASTHPM